MIGSVAKIGSLDGYLAVFAGAGLGGLARYIAGAWIQEKLGWAFPFGTFAVNVSGSFAIGLLMTILTARPDVSPNWRLFAVIGILGGYTTFSTFEYEVWRSARDGQILMSVTYLLSSMIAGYLAVWLGYVLAPQR
jgi:CrcB protein